MPRRRSNVNRTTYSTSAYRGGRKTFSKSRGGEVGRNNQYSSRRQVYYDIRKGLGLSGG